MAGASVRIQAMEGFSEGERFRGIPNPDGSTVLLATAYDNANMSLISEDLSVGVVSTTIGVNASSLQIGFLADLNNYEIYNVSIPEGAIKEAFKTSEICSINEDGSLILFGGLLNSNGFYNGMLIIEVNKANKSAVAKYFDDPCNFGSFTMSNGYTTTGRIENYSSRTSYIKSFVLTKKYLIYTFNMKYHNGTEEVGGNSTAMYYYTGSGFKTLAKYALYNSPNSSTARSTNSREVGWADDNTLLVIHSNRGKSSSSSGGSIFRKYVLDGGNLISSTSLTVNAYLQYNGKSQYFGADTWAFSKNCHYLSRYSDYSSYDDSFIYKFNPIDMTYQQLWQDGQSTYHAIYLPYVSDDGEYFLNGSNIRKVSDPHTNLYTAGTLSSRYFEVTNGQSYRSGTKQYRLSSPEDKPEYLAYPCTGGSIKEQNCIYGIVMERLVGGDIGEGRKLFDTDAYPDPSLQSKTVTPSAIKQTVTYDSNYDGLLQVTVNGDADLTAENIKSGINIFGVTGTYTGEIGGNE